MENFEIPTGGTPRQIEESGDITYIGYSSIGTPTSEGTWAVKKIDSSSGIVITFGEGSWDDRTTLTYN